ncbi:MAG: sarcosine oxidase [Pseudomonadales bacterium]
MNTVNLARRNPLNRLHQANGAQLTKLNEAEIVDHYGDSSLEEKSLNTLALCDLSALSRWGCKGAGAPNWIESTGLELPSLPNKAVLQSNGGLLARLSLEECLLLDGVGTTCEWPMTIEKKCTEQNPERVYSLPRADSHGWFALTGENASDTLAKVCGVDLRLTKFANGDVAQTSVARVNAIIIRADLKTVPCFYILSDLSSAEFLWTCLIDAMQEFEGRAVGFTAFKSTL